MSHLRRFLNAAAAALIVVALAKVAAPFLHPGLPSGHDASAHLTHAYLFNRSWSEGQIPVRWTSGVQAGDGQPLFNFYQPGLYYFIQATSLVSPALSVAFKLTLVLLWWFGAAATFFWLRPLGWRPAAFGALLFALSPYLILDVFVRAAYAEFAAVSIAPATLWAVDRFVRNGGLARALGASATLAWIPVCHLPGALVLLPAIVVYALVVAVVTRAPWQRYVAFAASALLAAGLAAFYLGPAIGELQFVSIDRMTDGYMEYARHFLTAPQWFDYEWGFGSSLQGTNDGLSFQVDIVQWLAGLAAAITLAVVAGKRALAPSDAVLAYWLGAAAFALFMTTSSSREVWATVPHLSFLQFPWRYLMLVSLSTAPIGALVLVRLRPPALQALAVIVVALVQLHVHGVHLGPKAYFTQEQVDIDAPDWPATKDARQFAFLDAAFTPVSARGDSPRAPCTWTVADGHATLEAIVAHDHHRVLNVTGNGAVLRFNSPHFPGWTIRVDGEESEATVDPETGYVEFHVPSGAHQIEATFENTPLRATADAVTAGSLGLWVFGAGTVLVRRSWRRPRADRP